MRTQRTAAAAALLVSASLAVASLTTVTAAEADDRRAAPVAPSFELVGRYAVPGGAEVSAVSGDRLYVLNGVGIDIVDISDPASPTKITTVDLATAFPGAASATSVTAHRGKVAVALPSAVKTNPGTVVVLSRTGRILASATVGALPDMVTFDDEGERLLVANEGEPLGYTGLPEYGLEVDLDPEGTVSVIDVERLLEGRRNPVRSIGFDDFNVGGPRAAELSADVRVFGPGASVAEDLEPEYVTVEGDRAFVTLQENNAIAELDLRRNRVVAIRPLALKDHSVDGQGLDPSDRDSANNGGINIGAWPVSGMPLPDGIASFRAGRSTFLVTANEGDARQDWPGYAEEIRVGSSSYILDPTAFLNAAALKSTAALGRLTVTNAAGRAGGDVDGDGDRDRIQVFGTRSASIWTPDGQLVWDSGDLFERVTAAANPLFFNSTNDANEFDTRSDNKGPEPEGVAVGKVGKRTLAFVVLERTGGFVVLDVTDPAGASFVQYANSRDFTLDPKTAATDSGPEVVRFVPAGQSPNGKPLVVVSNEVSGTVSIWSLATA
jgi:hypothetical protein